MAIQVCGTDNASAVPSTIAGTKRPVPSLSSAASSSDMAGRKRPATTASRPLLRGLDLVRASTRQGQRGYLIKLPCAGHQLQAVKIIASTNENDVNRTDPSSWADAEDVPRELWQDAAKNATVHCPFERSQIPGEKLWFRLVAVGVPEEGIPVLYRSGAREHKDARSDASAGASTELADDAPPAEPVHAASSKKQKRSARGGLGGRGGLGRGGRGPVQSPGPQIMAESEDEEEDAKDVGADLQAATPPSARPSPLPRAGAPPAWLWCARARR